MLELSKEVLDSIHQLDRWVQKNGWAGYDPYDIKGHPMYLRLTKSPRPLSDAFGFVYGYAETVFPGLLRKSFRVRKEVNAKGMALFARAYLDLYLSTGQERYLAKTKEALGWLKENPSQGYTGLCWGYPFDWQSLHFLPRGTPSGVVTSCVGDAFYTFYKATGIIEYLDICSSICNFFMNDLNVDNISDRKICFSYTPLDGEHCHNANLFVADFLIRIGVETGDKAFIEQGTRALNYTLGEQNEDGSFGYLGHEDMKEYGLSREAVEYIDHYHTGFVLRSLHSIFKATGDERVFSALEKCYNHYRQTLFENSTIPKLTPENKYPINIHSCSEAILCMSTLSSLFPDALDYAEKTFRWTRANMQTRNGWFIYMITNTRIRVLEWKIRIPYIRWAEAWMLRALSQYYLMLQEDVK
ncbi:hypothetical protein ACFLW2_03345 [Chloroflexota bacterium]